MPHLSRTGSILVAPPSPASSNNSSAYSRFSFRALRTSSSISTKHSKSSTEKTRTTGICSSATTKLSVTVNSKLVFGIRGTNCKPGLLFTWLGDNHSLESRLLFLPLPRSFKNDYIDLPSTILKQLMAIFKQAKAKIPSSSKFSEAFSHGNMRRLQELLEQAELWERCAQVDSKFLIGQNMHVLSTTDDCEEAEIVKRLLQQPNIFGILREAIEILDCKGLGIPSQFTDSTPPKVPTVKRQGSSSSFSLKPSSPLCDDHRQRVKELNTNLRQLACCDSIVSLGLGEIDQLVDEITALHIALYAWYAPFEAEEDIVGTVSSMLEDCFAAGGSTPKDVGTPAEKEAMSVSGLATGIQWAKDALKLKVQEQEFNVWCLALQRCRQVKATCPV